ncbi:hypothetical protein E2C01_000443 [Portunus trituberculatus]|uniref:Uncharacterized protein n=1 Tax=Portunus trituberculatus TaxID=210409 RepID=A0A5B7CEY7_PORTR|nr:hypothetical protein [Portunus trituberculatus]
MRHEQLHLGLCPVLGCCYCRESHSRAISRHLNAPSKMDMEALSPPWHTTQDYSKNPKPSYPTLATAQSLEAYKNHSKDMLFEELARAFLLFLAS